MGAARDFGEDDRVEGGAVEVEVVVDDVSEDVVEDVEDVDEVEESDELEDLPAEGSSEARSLDPGGLGPPFPPAFDANSLCWKWV